ncbi:MAG: hypothetical protein JW682_01725 [Campylobacterales bacterium]|nr:hypothetical protein [Campylobacterales bacterium]HEO99489.1 hypothetical protein [Campylobacterota bacterium]
MRTKPLFLILLSLFFVSCTQESQNSLSRSLQNWTGTNGVLDVYAGEKLVHRFINIDKLSTAYGTNDSEMRPYRYGYGIDDINFNYQKDPGEQKVYFEFSDYSTSYIFYERNINKKNQTNKTE